MLTQQLVGVLKVFTRVGGLAGDQCGSIQGIIRSIGA